MAERRVWVTLKEYGPILNRDKKRDANQISQGGYIGVLPAWLRGFQEEERGLT